jgi:hypothetical protein
MDEKVDKTLEHSEVTYDMVRVGPSTGPSVEDKLILALIDGNSEPLRDGATAADIKRWEKQRTQRLIDARKAIFGISPAAGPHETNHERALMWMAQERHTDQVYLTPLYRELNESTVGPNWKPRSIRALAKAAAEKFYGQLAEDVADRLRKKFKADFERLKYLLHHDYLPELFEFQALEEASRALKKVGISMNLARIKRNI